MTIKYESNNWLNTYSTKYILSLIDTVAEEPAEYSIVDKWEDEIDEDDTI